jgi:hypothetical protein
MTAMSQDPWSEMLANWRRATDELVANWGKLLEETTQSQEGAATLQEFEKNYLAMRAAMSQAAQTAAAPMIEAAGAVPMTEFRRLADQVQTILLRLDRIDDALKELRTGEPGAARKPRKKKEAK